MIAADSFMKLRGTCILKCRNTQIQYPIVRIFIGKDKGIYISRLEMILQVGLVREIIVIQVPSVYLPHIDKYRKSKQYHRQLETHFLIDQRPDQAISYRNE